MIKTIDHIINIDLVKKINMNKSINIKKNDTNSHKFVINIFDNSVPYNLTGSTARIYFEKADKTTVFADFTIDNALNGKISYLLTTQTVSYPGEVATEVTIYGTGGEILTSITFDFTVKDTVRNDAAIESTSEFTALTNALNAVNDAVGSLPSVAALNIDLQENIVTGDALKTDLETNISSGNALKTALESDIVTAGTKKTDLESVIATADLTTYASKGSVESVAASLAEIAKDEVYVESYPIIAPEADDSERIKRAIADLSNGGTLHFGGKTYNLTGITSNKPISLKGAGVSLTKFKNSGTGRMITYDYSVGGLTDVGKRRPIQISDITFEDAIGAIGTGVYVFKAYFIEFNRCFFTGFTAGYAVHLDAVLWAYFNNVSTDKSEIRCIDSLVPHSNNQIFFYGGEYRNPTTHAIYIENSDTLGVRDLTVEGYNGTPIAGIFLKNTTTTILEELYMEHLEGVEQSAIKTENCRTLSIKSSSISTNQEGKPAIWLSDTSITEIEKCKLSVDPIKVNSNCHGIKIKDSMLYGKMDIPDNVYYKIENCEPASATTIVKNPQYQPETFEGQGFPLSNRYIDSSFRTAIPNVVQTTGTPIATQDTTNGYYDSNSLKIVGVANDKALIESLGRIETVGQGAIISFMAKSAIEADFTFGSSIAVASGANKARLTTGWRRYFVFSLIQPTQIALANVSLWVTFSDSNTFWMDDVQIIPIDSYKESSKYLDNFRYIHTHGTSILNDIKPIVPYIPYFDKGIQFRKQTFAPTSPQEGSIYYADGTSWNPLGSGKGFYGYDGTMYTKL